MQRKVLASSHQHLMAEAPALWEHWGKGDDSLESFTIIFADDNQRHTY